MAFLDDQVDGFFERRVRSEADHRDTRDHDLVDAPVTELDDRVDHLLLLGLEDALLPAALDQDLELFGAHDPRRDITGAEDPRDPVGHRGQGGHERTQDPQQERDEPAEAERVGLSVGEGEALRHELAEDDREQAQEEGHDDEGDGLGRGRKDRDAGAREHGLEARGQVDRGVGRGQEPDEGQADLGDRQETTRLGDERLDPAGTPVALLDELVDAGPAHRHEGDLGGHEDALEEGQQDDDDDLDDGVHQRSPETGGPGRSRPGQWWRLPRARASHVAPGSGPARRPRAYRRARPGHDRTRSGPRSRPISTGATSIVSTPMNAPSPMSVGFLCVPS